MNEDPFYTIHRITSVDRFWKKTNLLKLIAVMLFFSLHSFVSIAQIQVFVEQQFSFGTLAIGSEGGTVTLSPQGERTATGDIILLHYGVHQELLIGLEAPIGAVVHIQNSPNVKLIGSNGGEIILSLGASDPASPLISGVGPPDRNHVYFGGTIIVGNILSAPAGSYTGSITVNFIQE